MRSGYVSGAFRDVSEIFNDLNGFIIMLLIFILSFQSALTEDFKFCRVLLPDNSTAVVCARPGQTIQQVLGQLFDKRNLTVESTEVFLLGSDKVCHEFVQLTVYEDRLMSYLLLMTFFTNGIQPLHH